MCCMLLGSNMGCKFIQAQQWSFAVRGNAWPQIIKLWAHDRGMQDLAACSMVHLILSYMCIVISNNVLSMNRKSEYFFSLAE